MEGCVGEDEVVAEVAGDGAEDAQDEEEDGTFGEEEGDAVDGVRVIGVLGCVTGREMFCVRKGPCATFSLSVLDVRVGEVPHMGASAVSAYRPFDCYIGHEGRLERLR